jgi:hypothetical protein
VYTTSLVYVKGREEENALHTVHTSSSDKRFVPVLQEDILQDLQMPGGDKVRGEGRREEGRREEGGMRVERRGKREEGGGKREGREEKRMEGGGNMDRRPGLGGRR